MLVFLRYTVLHVHSMIHGVLCKAVDHEKWSISYNYGQKAIPDLYHHLCVELLALFQLHTSLAFIKIHTVLAVTSGFLYVLLFDKHLVGHTVQYMP